MEITIERYTKEKINDVLEFERELRRQEENTYFWEIDDIYTANVTKSFDDPKFINTAISLLAYRGGHVIGRIDAALVNTHFDGTVYDAYLNWICVLKKERHAGVAQMLLRELKRTLKELKVESLIALTAGNDEAARFYDSAEDTTFYRGVAIKV